MLNDDVISLIKQGINSQKDLLDNLKNLGYEITQSSVSRKLKQLGINKINGKYQFPTLNTDTQKVKNIIFCSPNLLVIRTASGFADAVATIIDQQLIGSPLYPEFIGSIAGDDTIFLSVNLKENDPSSAIKTLRKSIS